jgi:hypothetical protein
MRINVTRKIHPKKYEVPPTCRPDELPQDITVYFYDESISVFDKVPPEDVEILLDLARDPNVYRITNKYEELYNELKN